MNANLVHRSDSRNGPHSARFDCQFATGRCRSSEVRRANGHGGSSVGDTSASSYGTMPFFAGSRTEVARLDEIKGIARVEIHPGKLDEWKRLTEQAMEIVRTRDPGTLQYEVFFNDDES